MTGVAGQGSQWQLNAVTNVAAPIVQTTTPGSGVIGQYWVNASGASVVKVWDGTTWVTPGNPYLALLTADPTGVTTVAGLSECADSGYSRIQVAWSTASSTLPVTTSNNSLLQFGPFSVNMSLPCQWLALVTTASGTGGLLLETWTISTPQQVLATQYITLAPTALSIINS